MEERKLTLPMLKGLESTISRGMMHHPTIHLACDSSTFYGIKYYSVPIDSNILDAYEWCTEMFGPYVTDTDEINWFLADHTFFFFYEEHRSWFMYRWFK